MVSEATRILGPGTDNGLDRSTVPATIAIPVIVQIIRGRDCSIGQRPPRASVNRG